MKDAFYNILTNLIFNCWKFGNPQTLKTKALEKTCIFFVNFNIPECAALSSGKR